MSKRRRSQSSSLGKKARSTKKTSRPRRGGSSNLWLIIGAAVLIAIIAIAISLSQGGPSVVADAYEEVPNEWHNGRILGDPNAQVTLQVWEDFL
ncbi:MAG: hypothetical protein AAF702_42625 [Chloroflexota bacterium]